jgi:geranylgeranyl pyrophosphate synthase
MSSEITKSLMLDLAKRGSKGLEFAKKTILEETIDYPELREARKHYLTYWNDFTHAGMLSLACDGVNGNVESSIPTQAAITMMAAAFDLHDDIIDKSETKHLTPTVYGNYGGEITLLLGNAFWIEGFSLIVKSIDELAPNKMREIARILKSNLFEVGNAHASELGFRGKTKTTKADCIMLVEKKAASIEIDMHLGAIVGGGTTEQVKALARYGRIIGILTTLREEFIDVFEIEELSQKVQIERLPIPILFAMQDKQGEKEIGRILGKKKISNNDVEEIINIVFESENVKNLKNDMEDLIIEATQLLPILPKKETRNKLKQWVSSMLEDL